MERIVYRITLDSHKTGIQRTLQGFETADNMARTIAVNITASGDTYEIPLDNVVAMMYVTTPNASEPSINECRIEDNTIYYDVLPIVEEGITEMKIKLIETSVDGAKRVLLAPKFVVEVTESGTEDDSAEQTTTFTALENAIARAQGVYDARLLRVEIDKDCVFRVIYADGTVYENHYLNEALYNGNALLSESWARGGTGIREGENTNNSMYFSNVSKSSSIEASASADMVRGLVDMAKLYSTYTSFDTNFKTGELEYISASHNFDVNEETGELEVEGELFDLTEEISKNTEDIDSVEKEVTQLKSETKLLTVFVTPQMFGAVADGVTDDTEAFKKAVATGEALYIPKGNYYLSEVLSYADLETVKIICDGSIYMESQEAQTNLFYMSNCKNVEIAGLKVESTRDKTGTAPDGHTRTDYSSSNVVPFYIYNSEYVTVKNSVFINPDYSFFIRGLFDDEAEVKTKVVIDNVSVVNPCMGCFVDRLKEFNISNSSFYMANGLSAGDHAIYATRYIEKVNIDACYFWTDESDEAIGPMLDFTAYEKCVQNAIISNCIFDCRIPIYAQGNGKYVISNCISKSSSYFVRPSGGVDVTILNCQIESDADVISPSHTDKEQYIAPMNVLISNSRVNALHLYNFDSTEEAEINITTNDCDIETTGLAIYSSVSTVNYKFINSRLTMAAEESFVRYYHANRMEFVGCEIVSPKGLFYCKADIEENNVTLINCFLEAPSLYRSTEPTNKITCYNSYLNGELIDKPYLTEDELSDAINDALSIAKESGEFDGTDGKDGSTPVKGTDYFTDSDKAEMVNSVISELPTVTMVGVDEDGTEHTWTIYGKVVS